MQQTWQLQEAKNKFSQVVNLALRDGPQIVTKRGVEAVVIMSADEYRRLREPKRNLADFFRDSPLVGLDLDFSRDQSLPREIDL